MKPTKQIVPLAVGLSWTTGGVFQQKMDGKSAILATDGGGLAGENVGGVFTAFDCVAWKGQDVRGLPLRERLVMRDELCAAAQIPIVPEVTSEGGKFLESILNAGGEGAVFKSWDSTYFAQMMACKRLETWICRVAGFNGGCQSVRIADATSGAERGNLPLFGGRCDRVRVGSLVKVEGFGLHRSGLVREPRVCKDTAESWLVKF
jgi:hypothetical protein